MAGGGEPIPDCSSDRTALHRPAITLRGLARDEEEKAGACGNGLLQSAVQHAVSGVQIMAVEIDGEIGLDEASRETAVPCAVESDARRRLRLCWLRP
jgi:hypothetical protein